MCFDIRQVLFSCVVLGVILATIQPASADTPSESTPVILTNAAQVRALTPAAAAKQIPVRLRGVVLEKNAANSFSILDETAGLYVECSPDLLSKFKSHDLIEVEGVSNPGKFAPYLDARSVRKLGAGTVPAPRLASRDDLLSGQMDAQWIEVVGVVRRAQPGWHVLDLEVDLENGVGRMLVHFPDGSGLNITVDSTVQFQGLCFYQFNKARQLLRPYLSIPAGGRIVVTVPATTNLSVLPVHSIESLTQFNPGQSYVHRVRVRGVVVHSEPGEGFWIRGGGHGLHVVCDGPEPLEAGAEVDVFGFLSHGEYGPMLEDAIFQKTGKTHVVQPIHLNKAAQALDYDSDLVECEAVIQEQWPALDGCRLKLSDGDTEFPAVLRLTNHNDNVFPQRWLPGARVRVAGICSVGVLSKSLAPGTMEPQLFQIQLRSPADMVVLQPPSWWTSQHVAWLLGAAALMLLLAVGVIVWISRRHLRQQAIERMKSEAEFSAVWNERNRMAREMHDTLAQGLSAISMQLEVVKRELSPEAKAREPLEVARSLARANMTEARNAIWNVRAQVLETGDLATALDDILRNLTEGTETKRELRVRGKLRRLPPVTENNLLRIGQEAIANAAKYAQAKNILVALDFEARQLRLSVSDDGKGFDVQSPPPSEGGFGLTGMRERAEQLHAEFSVTSEPGEGTIVTLVLPLLMDDRH